MRAGWPASRGNPAAGTCHKQHCLELDDPVERLRYLRPLFEITDRPPRTGAAAVAEIDDPGEEDDDRADADPWPDEDDAPDSDDEPTQT